MSSTRLLRNGVHPPVELVPILPGESGAGFPWCLAVATYRGAKLFVATGATRYATGYLGAVTDRAGEVVEWLEFWVPTVETDAGAAAADRSGGNVRVDQHWLALLAHWKNSPASGWLATGREEGLPGPLVLDAGTLQWLPLRDSETAAPAQLCRDDARLEAAGLPRYSRASVAFLTTGEQRFFASGPGQPAPSGVRPWADLLPPGVQPLVFSADGRGLAGRRLAPFSLGEFADLLAGRPLAEEGTDELSALAIVRQSRGAGHDLLANPHRHLLRHRASKEEWLVEIHCHKARLLGAALAEVAAAGAAEKKPFLNLAETSFGLRLGVDSGPAAWWSFALTLNATSCAAIERHDGATVVYRESPDPRQPPVYQRPGLVERQQREVGCRLRLVAKEAGGTVVEATLGGLSTAGFDGEVGALYLPLAEGRIGLWGRLSRDTSLAREERRFRTIAASLPAAVVPELERMQGYVWRGAWLEIFPAVGFGDDLYSLGVLATRLFLTADSGALPTALDAVLSLAEQLRTAPPAEKLPTAIAAAWAREPRFAEWLHPGRASLLPVAGESALEAVSPELWWEVLALIVRLFPGAVAPSFLPREGAADLEAAAPAFLEADRAVQALVRRLTDRVLPAELLNRRVRSIIDSVRQTSAG